MDNTRKNILINSHKAGACHVGSSLSCVEILKAIYSVIGDGYFIFSKASGAAALYQILAERGVINNKDVAGYLKKYPLASKEVPGVLHSVGSIGHGLNVAVGLAFADRTKNVYCLISDGEMNEGSTWEAILFASQHNLFNLKIIIDYNKLQACGSTKDIIDLERPIDGLKKIAFLSYADGHNIKDLIHVIERKKFYKINGPRIVVANTIKGYGVPEIEGKYEWHYKNISDEQLKRWI